MRPDGLWIEAKQIEAKRNSATKRPGMSRALMI